MNDKLSNSRKMLIITTSNEELIEKFHLNECENTQVIDINENQLPNSISKEKKNDLDLHFLAQFSEFNNRNDQMYKRILNSSKFNRAKQLKSSKRNNDLLCVICGDCAIGFNYDVLTCASCKAFFRRNAQYDPDKLRCLTGEKSCSVSFEIVRKCQRCRLNRCLTMGMRKDFILTEEQKQRRRKRIEENRQLSKKYSSVNFSNNNNFVSESISEIDRLLMDTDNNNLIELEKEEKIRNERLSLDDWSDLEYIRKSYKKVFENRDLPNRCYETSDRVSALIIWSQFASEKALKLINFFQQIDSFENLNLDDKFTLIKYNLLPLFLIHRCLDYNPLTGKFNNNTNEDPSKRRQFFTLCYGTSGIRENYCHLVKSFARITEQDSTLIYLLLLILLFSKGLSMSEYEPILLNSSIVHRGQSHFLKLIWNYLLYKYGDIKTFQIFININNHIAKLQAFTISFRNYFRNEINSIDSYEKLAPIMQSLLNIK